MSRAENLGVEHLGQLSRPGENGAGSSGARDAEQSATQAPRAEAAAATSTRRSVSDFYLVIIVRRIIGSLTAAMPGWLIVILGVCLMIPLVRLAALLFTVVLCLIQPARIRRAANAWKDSKPQRRSDEMPGQPSGDFPSTMPVAEPPPSSR